jgi:hypothetical protein
VELSLLQSQAAGIEDVTILLADFERELVARPDVAVTCDLGVVVPKLQVAVGCAAKRFYNLKVDTVMIPTSSKDLRRFCRMTSAISFLL